MKLALDASDFAQVADAWAKSPEITREELLKPVTASDVRLQGELKKNLPRGAAGAAGLAGSVATQEQASDDSVIGMVFSPMPYALYIETGTKPHWGPIQPLLDWVHAKLGLGDDDEERSAAYAIRAAIAKRGTKANPVWQTTWTKNQGYIRAQFDAAMVRIAARLAGATP